MSSCTGTAEFATDFNLVEAIEKGPQESQPENLRSFPPLKGAGKCSPVPFRAKHSHVCPEKRAYSGKSL
jgi:hypothetical protein